MARVIWTPEAQQHLAAIFEYMSDVAPIYAAPLIAGISAAMDPVSEFPTSGRMVPEFDSPLLREVIFENYRIVYTSYANDVFVLAVFHGACDVAARLRRIVEGD